ncbi:MAG: type II secretion system F family protein [Methylococcaceae bacterium]|nr:type II secretion system F family protein [Methylococcaceae bacterium]
MPHFKCQVRNADGKRVVSIIEADNPALAAKILSNQGFTPLTITKTNPRPDVIQQFNDWQSLRNISLNDRLLFCRQMHSLAKAGVPLTRALRSLIESTRNNSFAGALKDIVRRLEAGTALSLSMAYHPEIFNPLFINIINVGENSGELSRAFLQIGQYLQQEKDIQSRVKSALRYPSMVIIAIIIAMAIVNIYVIPAFKGVFDNAKAELPWQTKLLMNISDFTVHNWSYLLLGCIVLGVFGVKYINTPNGLLQWDKLLLKLPVLGSIVERSAMERFSRSLAMTLDAGVPLIQSLSIVSATIGNSYISAKLLKMRLGIEKGETVSRMAQNSRIFPPVVIQMLIVGEETGNVSSMLLEVADFYAAEVDADLKNLTSVIEPILLVVIGIMVLVLALGIFLPMWDLSSAIH